MNCRRHIGLLFAAGLTLAVSFCPRDVSAAVAASCLADAKQIADQNSNTVGTAVFIDQGQYEQIPINGGHSDNLNSGRIYFTIDAETPLPAPPRMVSETDAWSPAQHGCGGKLRSIRYKLKPAAPAPEAVAGSESPQDLAINSSFEDLSLQELRKTISEAQKAQAKRANLIHAHAAEEAVAETVQILGQIVVDRATAEAYAQIKARLEDLLDCDTAAPTFQATCSVLVPLRVEDVAASRDALLGALATDVFELIRAKIPASKQSSAVIRTILGVLLPVIARPSLKSVPGQAKAVIDVITEELAQDSPTTAAEATVNLSARGMLQCVGESLNQPDDLARCDIGRKISDLNTDFPAAKPAARTLANQVLAVSASQADARARLSQAVDTLFATACMLAKNEATPALACDDPNRIAAPASDAQWLALIHPIFSAGAAQDTNSVVAGTLHILTIAVTQTAKDEKERLVRNHTRAFQLIGALLDYGSTYVETTKSPSADDQKAAHDRRTKILESLTKSMTVRTGRGGDVILSIGGSLRSVAGGRIGTQISDASFYGPVSLPLGFGLDCLSSSTNWGFHLELGIVDLGEYVGLDSKGTVRSPDLQQAFAPNLTVAAEYGKSIPFFFGPTAGYAPTYVVNSAREDKRGTLNVGITAGFYVPLFDFN